MSHPSASSPIPARLCASLLLCCALAMPGCRKQQAPAPSPSIKTITTPSGIEMVLVPAGSFLMGSDSGESDEKPAHRVTLAAFYIDRNEVTQKDFEAAMGTNPSKFKNPAAPVERVSWLSAIKYCNMRSLKEGLHPCYDIQKARCDFSASGYRLPTEAEWEYACRAGATTAYSYGNSPANLASFAWLKTNANQTTHPVRQKQPNAWGLYDMHGNVAEWCNDRYAEKAYSAAPADNPRGPETGEERILRGGSWRSAPEACRSSARASESPGLADVCFGYEAYGFRCVRAAP